MERKNGDDSTGAPPLYAPNRVIRYALIFSLLCHGALFVGGMTLGKVELKTRDISLAVSAAVRRGSTVNAYPAPPKKKTLKGKQARTEPAGGGKNRRRFTSDVVKSHNDSIRNSLRYPRRAERRGWEGKVVIRAKINPAGRADRVMVLRSSGYEILDAAAAAAVRRHFFTPGAETETIVLRFLFRLSDNED